MVEAERALIAAKDGDLQTLRSLRRSTPFAADGFGATALHYASRTGQMECVKWLVEAIGISPNVRGRSGATPLHDAAAQGQLDCVKYFLASGAVDVETRDGSGHTVLHLAARFGRFESVKWLTEKGNSNARAKSRNHMTPVHFAASGGHLTCLELLVFKAGYRYTKSFNNYWSFMYPEGLSCTVQLLLLPPPPPPPPETSLGICVFFFLRCCIPHPRPCRKRQSLTSGLLALTKN